MESERLYFRKMTKADKNDLCKILQDDTTMYAYEGGFSDKETDDWIDRTDSCGAMKTKTVWDCMR